MKVLWAILLIVLCPALSAAQGQNTTGTVFLDLFAGPEGAVIYPQYAWGLKTSAGDLGGYGFVEVAPHEPFFTNHLVVYTSPMKQFSVHTETGGLPGDSLGFFQVGPRLNIHETITPLKRPLHHFFVVALPHVAGIRPNNLLIAAATNRFKLTSGLKVSAEGYRRIFGDNVPDYSEYWLLFHPEKIQHFSFGAFVLHHGSQKVFAVGVRASS